MIEKLALFMARKIKYHDPEGEASVEVLSYEIARLTNLYGSIILTVLCGLMTGELIWTVIAMGGFIVLRKYSGGVHMPTLTSCTIASVAIFVIAPFMHFNEFTLISNTLLCALTMLLFNNKKTNSIALSVIIILSNLMIKSPALSLVFAIQTLTVLLEGGGILKQTLARILSRKIDKSARNNIGTTKTLLGAQKLPAELENLKKETK